MKYLGHLCSQGFSVRSEEGLEGCLGSHVQQPAQPCVAVMRAPGMSKVGMAHKGVHRQQARQKTLVSGIEDSGIRALYSTLNSYFLFNFCSH